MGVGVGSGGSFFGSDQIYVIMPVWEGAGNAAWSRNGGLRNGPGWRVAAAEPRAAPAADEGRFFGVSGS